MSPALMASKAALGALRNKIEQKWAEAICADHGAGGPIPFSVPLRPGLSSGKAIERADGSWHEWHTTWRSFDLRTVCRTAGVSPAPNRPPTMPSPLPNPPSSGGSSRKRFHSPRPRSGSKH